MSGPARATAPCVALLTDFGTADGYAGVLKGVVLGLAPGIPLVDITHDIPPQDVAAGAWVLYTTWRNFPPGTIFLCVVDPGVGTARAPLAAFAGDRLFVGPDNGLFGHVFAEAAPARAVRLDDPRFQGPGRSATFHGRDIFAPAAGHLAAGRRVEEIGSPLAPAGLLVTPLPAPTREGATWVGTVLHADRYGNLITAFGPHLAAAFAAAPGAVLSLDGRPIGARAATFAEGPAGEPFVYEDSSGHLAVAVRNGSAAALLGLGRGAIVRIAGL